MKKLRNIISLLVAALSLTAVQSCKTELDERYQDPEQTDIPNIRAFMTQILNNSRLRSEYWHYRTFVLPHHARYTQTTYFANNNTMYQQQDSYTNDYWRDFYSPGMLGVFRVMERTYAALPEAERAEYDAFMHATRVIVYGQAAKLVNNFGDIPFSEAGSLPATDQIVLGKFDDQKELYNQFITAFTEAAEFFRTYQNTNDFVRADIINRGNGEKWRRYANSLRLRALMQISKSDEGRARTEIMTMLNAPEMYPLIDGTQTSLEEGGRHDVLNQKLTTYTSSLLDAVRELNSHYAPDYMLNTVLKTANDPRMDMLFGKYGRTVQNVFTPNAEFQALPITTTEAAADAEYSNASLRRYAIVDSTTSWINSNLPGILMTTSEVNFIKAEAQERWGSTASAQTAYETAVAQSIDFYYYLNNASSNTGAKVARPSAEAVQAFIKDSNIAYTGAAQAKLQLIGTQKWLHFGWLQAEQAWADYRRTGYPVLPAFPVSNLNGFQNPPLRLLYPSNEVTNNSMNYEAVRSKDTRTTRIFWDVD